MNTIIGKKYEETKASLRRRVREGTIEVLETKVTTNYSCYFCRQHIDGKVIILIETHKDGESKYPIDELCYRNSKLYIYYQGITLSLN